MVADPTAAATKADIADIRSILDYMQKEMATKDDLQLVLRYAQSIENQMTTKEDLEQLEHRMLILIENARVDILDAHKDDLENVKIRLGRVERKVEI
jgi:hypothetical protein